MKKKVDIIFIAFVVSVTIIFVTGVIAIATANPSWGRVGLGSWVVLFASLIVGAIRTLLRKG